MVEKNLFVKKFIHKRNQKNKWKNTLTLTLTHTTLFGFSSTINICLVKYSQYLLICTNKYN